MSSTKTPSIETNWPLINKLFVLLLVVFVGGMITSGMIYVWRQPVGAPSSSSDETHPVYPAAFSGAIWGNIGPATVAGFHEVPGFGRLVECKAKRVSVVVLEYPGESLAIGDPVSFQTLRWYPGVATSVATYYARKKK